jgi:hypothetical protein
VPSPYKILSVTLAALPADSKQTVVFLKSNAVSAQAKRDCDCDSVSFSAVQHPKSGLSRLVLKFQDHTQLGTPGRTLNG